MNATAEKPPHIEVSGLTLAYGDDLIQRDISFKVNRGDIFIIMGGSGCGKSTLLKAMIGLLEPTAGTVRYDGVDFWTEPEEQRERLKRRFGVMFQTGALWSSMTLGENIALSLQEYTDLPPATVREVVSLKLALVGLAGLEEAYPAEISGGMRKRAGLARAMALDPDILFFDEMSAGLDPINSRRLDDLVLELRDGLGTTIVVVTHELPSIFTIGTRAAFLDDETRTMIACGDPKRLVVEGPAKVRRFLTRAATEPPGGST
jgi:phospholipid/cholesterol/gamma-HCH transport system ATP-binding protein